MPVSFVHVLTNGLRPAFIAAGSNHANPAVVPTQSRPFRSFAREVTDAGMLGLGSPFAVVNVVSFRSG